MKLSIYYFDPTVKTIFIEKTNESGEKYTALSSPYNFVAQNEIVMKTINVDHREDAENHIDKGYNFHKVEKYTPAKVGTGIYFDETTKCYRAARYGFVIHDKASLRLTLISPMQVSKDKMTAYFIVFPVVLFHHGSLLGGSFGASGLRLCILLI